MSLKQECIDIISLITEPLKKDEYDLYEPQLPKFLTLWHLVLKNRTEETAEKWRKS